MGASCDSVSVEERINLDRMSSGYRTKVPRIYSDEEVKVLIHSKNIIIKFLATWSDDCKNLSIFYEEISEKIEEFDFYIIDIDSDIDAMESFNLNSIPTFKAFVNGREVGSYTGIKAKEIYEFVVKYSSQIK
jgi:thioredoxin-like negative regulator of GroEL